MQPLPQGWEDKAGPFGKLLLVRVLREEKLVFACARFVAATQGAEFMEPPPWTLDDVFPDTSARTPIIFILSTGARGRGGQGGEGGQGGGSGGGKGGGVDGGGAGRRGRWGKLRTDPPSSLGLGF